MPRTANAGSSSRRSSRRNDFTVDDEENVDSKASVNAAAIPTTATAAARSSPTSTFTPLRDSNSSNRPRDPGPTSRSKQTAAMNPGHHNRASDPRPSHVDASAEASKGGSRFRGRATQLEENESQDDELLSSEQQHEKERHEQGAGASERRERQRGDKGIRDSSGPSKRMHMTNSSDASRGPRRFVSQSPSSVDDRSRGRRNNGGGQRDESEEGEEEEEEQEGSGEEGRENGHHQVEASYRARTTARVLARGEDGFVHGSIVRVKLTDFVTYDNVEFFPGPHLNMIVGPNGTGKSTIASALCLGLGWKPQVLGRANDVASYVKQGADAASTMVELKNTEGPNFVIGRSISRISGASQWQVNGKSSTARAVSELVEKLGIDMGNLCCFLPQDRVADFARMSPPELLRETQKAAGSSKMLTWHDELIELGRKAAAARRTMQTEQEECSSLENRNEQMERDVRQAERRHELELQLKVLAIRIAIAEYNEAQVKYNKYKDLRNKHKETLNQLKSILSPLDEKQESIENLREKISLKIQSVSKAIETLVRDLKKTHRAHESLTTDFESTQDKQATLKAKEDDRKRVIERLVQDIEKLQEVIGEQPEVGDTSAIDAELRSLREAYRRIEEALIEKNNELDDLQSSIRQLHLKKTATLQELSRMDDVKERRLLDLEKKDADTAKAVRWLRKNQHLFEGKVYEPIMLELSVREQRNAAAVESVINWSLLRTFVCESRTDYDTFYRLVQKGEGLRVNAYEWGDGKSLKQYLQERPRGAEEKIRELGFDSYLIDMVEGPEAVLRCLCSRANMHQIPATSESTVNPDAVQRADICRRYIIGRQQYATTRSEYGTRQWAMSSQALKPVRTFNLSVDMQLKAKLNDEMKRIAEQASRIEAENSTRSEEIKKLKEEREKLKAREQELKGQKIDATKARTQWERNKVTLVSKQKILKDERNKPTAQDEQKRLTQRLRKLNNDIIGHARKMKDLMAMQVGHRQEFEVLRLDLAQNKSKLASLMSLKKNSQEFLRDAQDALEKAAQHLTKAKEDAMRCRGVAAQIVSESDEEVIRRNGEVDADNSLRNRPLHELQHEQMEISVEIESIVEVSPGIMEAYNRRKKEIKRLQINIAKLEKEKEKVDGEIKKYEELWLPALGAIRESVNNNFTRAFNKLGCAGEVHISRNDDYEKWGMDILVKFRDTEQLQLLTAQRQSGGERSLSTILYLMSLLEMSRSPFSLVDEINQGMDQRAERAVHDQMVDVTCREAGGQYFLITPKLLPHLKYHDLMRVLIINNGEWLPQSFSFSHYIGARKRKRGMADGASNGRSTATTAP